MKAKLPALLLALSLAVPFGARAESHNHHDHGGSAPQKLQLNAGKKWATDDALRRAMNQINQAISQAVPQIHHNQFSDSDYQQLATTVSKNVAYAVEHCKLQPKADAMLHLVIADLLAGAEVMEGKSAEARHDGAVKVLHALQAYGKHFQHPGWKTP